MGSEVENRPVGIAGNMPEPHGTGRLKEERAGRKDTELFLFSGLCQHLLLGKPNQMPTGKRVWAAKQPLGNAALGALFA